MTMTNEYLETQVLTATPHQLHLMVIDGALRHATSAQAALQSGQLARAETQLKRANECVAELIAGLDAAHQPELVDQLRSLFVFVQQALADAERKHDAGRLGEALGVLRLHRETWIALGDKLLQEAFTSHSEPKAAFSWTS
jgi:flagellar secretion chaperone FliS